MREHVDELKQTIEALTVIDKMKSGEKDDFGVIGLNAFVGERETWCLTDAPNAEAVHKSTRDTSFSWFLRPLFEVRPHRRRAVSLWRRVLPGDWSWDYRDGARSP